MVANGETLDLLAQTTVSLQVAGVKANYPCLVTSELSQECIIGANFLLENKCIIDLHNWALLAGGQTTQFLVQGGSGSTLSQFVTSSFRKPLYCQETLRSNFPSPLSTATDQGATTMKPAPKFIETKQMSFGEDGACGV